MRAALVALAMSTMALRAAAQAPVSHPDLTGVWVMDTTKFHKTDSVLVALTLTVARRGDTLTVSTEGSDLRGGVTSSFVSKAVYRLDGAPTQNTMTGTTTTLTSQVSWDGPTLVLTSSGERNGKSYRTTERWTLDAASRTMSRQATFLMGGMDRSQVLVFSRR
ncbi:MAG TPA: hypothetical protein VGI83_02950 [Gemmatimonadales bacterium]